MGTPGKAVRRTGRTWVVRSGRPTGCAFGEVRDAPKPNERVDHKETKTAARFLGAPGPEGLKVVGGASRWRA